MHEMIYINGQASTALCMPQYIMYVQAQLKLVSQYFDISAGSVERLQACE